LQVGGVGGKVGAGAPSKDMVDRRCHNAKTNRTDSGFGGPHGRPSLR
jgi:hypothetical protein